jgi:hypothetical protein
MSKHYNVVVNFKKIYVVEVPDETPIDVVEEFVYEDALMDGDIDEVTATMIEKDYVQLHLHHANERIDLDEFMGVGVYE